MPAKNLITNPYKPGDENQAHFDAGTVRYVFAALNFFEKYFRYEIEGLENIPKKGGVLLAMNHGFFFIDLPLIAKHLLLKRGRRIHTVAEHLTWKLPIIREFMLNIGVMDGTPKNALRILRGGHAMIVCPGGAKEAVKPYSKRYELMWENHYGFVKCAIASGVPIVPCISIGIDEAYIMLNDGYHRWFNTFVPLPLFVGLGLLPFPVKIKHYVGKPITHNYKPKQYKDMKVVESLHRRVLNEAERVKEHGLKQRKLFGLL